MPDLNKLTVPVQEGNVEEAILIRTGLGALAKVRLFKDSFAPTQFKVEADFEAGECDYAGYSAVTVAAWDPVGIESGTPNAFFTNATSLIFQATDSVTPNLVGGAWLNYNDATPTHRVLEYVIFDPPVPMNVALATLNMEWKLRFPGPGEVSYSY